MPAFLDMLPICVRAEARGSAIQTIAESQLGNLRAQLLELDPQLGAAQQAEKSHRHALKARGAENSLEICTVIDEVHDTLGRPAGSVDFALVVGSGRQQWTRVNRRKQPVLMVVLAGNLRSTEHPGLKARKEDWASRIDAKAQSQTQCVDAFSAAEDRVRSNRSEPNGWMIPIQPRADRTKKKPIQTFIVSRREPARSL